MIEPPLLLLHSPCPPPLWVNTQAEALSTLLSATAAGTWLTTTLGPSAWVFVASALILPTVLLPSVGALAALGAVGVMAAVTVGCVVSVC
jgi:hypothetical protein